MKLSVACLLLGHKWVKPSPLDIRQGEPFRCARCGAATPLLSEPKPDSKHVPGPPEDKMLRGRETKSRP